ncbi:MAG: hypothetical protein QMB65_05825, partial [Vicingaceae bacterium]
MKLFIIIITLVLFFVFGGIFIKYEKYGELKNVFRYIYFNITTAPNDIKPESISILIDQDSFKKIIETRELALKSGVYISDSKDYVPVKIIHKKDTLTGKIRLKGALNDHWNDTKKWSFRIKLDNKKTILGL